MPRHPLMLILALAPGRTQLKPAAAKTGAKRQADLVRIVLTGPAIFNAAA